MEISYKNGLETTINRSCNNNNLQCRMVYGKWQLGGWLVWWIVDCLVCLVHGTVSSMQSCVGCTVDHYAVIFTMAFKWLSKRSWNGTIIQGCGDGDLEITVFSTDEWYWNDNQQICCNMNDDVWCACVIKYNNNSKKWYEKLFKGCMLEFIILLYPCLHPLCLCFYMCPLELVLKCLWMFDLVDCHTVIWVISHCSW